MASEPDIRSEPAATEVATGNARNGAVKGRDREEPAAVVGLGASAGGLAVLRQFFSEMSPESGLAFVVVMHLSPEFESQLASILQQKTSMPVIQVRGPVKVKPNHVYVIPPNHQLAFDESTLHLVEPQQALGKRLTIDLFFRTLAHAYGHRAVGVILSGTESDGVIGLKHVRAQGGVTMAQDPTEAEFDSMPLTAIGTGVVDWVLPVGQMAPKLMEFVENENRMQLPPEIPEAEERDAKVQDAPGGETVAEETRDRDDESALAEVLAHVRQQTGHDFSHYKRATVLRRIARRMQVNSMETIPYYLAFLRKHPAEARALLHDLLIGVTHFFRDPQSFAALEENIPQLFVGKGKEDEIRVWVAGCASGEEAYSIAMLLCEHAERLDSPPAVQIFATDIDEQAIQEAREGLYPSTIEADVSPERLRRFFIMEDNSYRVTKEVRAKVLFAAHNLLSDAPFSRVDLVTCRNLLIYLNRHAQEQVFDVFHFALRPGGLLFIGGAETADNAQPLFSSVDGKHHVYVRRSMPRPTWKVPLLPARASRPRKTVVEARPAMLPAMSSPKVKGAGTETVQTTFAAQERRSVLFGELHLRLLEQYGPPSVVVNEAHDIVHLSEHAGRYLKFRAGAPSTNLIKVVHRSLQMELRTALYRAAQNKENVIAPDQKVEIGGASETIDLHVRPIHPSDSAHGFFLILFEKRVPALGPEAAASRHETVNRELDNELRFVKEQLNGTIEQYETSTEELRASNEELQAMNEELRSASEELETSKEELQSVNEELTTVNQDLKDKVEEVSRANSDLQNLMAATDVGTIFLDRQLRIERFTPPVQKIFNLLPSDVGRPISDITHELRYETLIADAQQAIHKLTAIEHEVHGEGDRWFLARTAPYRTVENKIDGVVLTFIDITERHRSEEQLRGSERRYRTLFDLVPLAVYSTDAEGVIQQFNRRAVELWGREPDRAEKFCGSFKIFYPDGTSQPHDQCPMARALRGEKLEPADLEIMVEDENGARKDVIVSPKTLENEQGEIVGAINCLYDITDRKRAEQSLVEAAKQREAFYQFVHRRHEAKSLDDIYAAAIDAILAVVHCDRAAILISNEKGVMRFVDWHGLSDSYREAVEGHSPWQPDARDPQPLFAGDINLADIPKSVKASAKAEGIGGVAFFPLVAEGKLIGQFMMYYDKPHVFDDEEVRLSLTVTGQLALGVERKRAEEALRRTEERFGLLVEGAKDYAMFLLNPDNKITFWSAGATRVFGWSREEAEGQSGALIFTPEDRARGAVEQEVKGAVKDGRALDRRYHLRKDGSRFWTDGVMMRLDNEAGEVRGLAKIARDATDEREAEEALRHARDEMEQRVVERTHDLVATNRELERTMAQRQQLEKELLQISEREKRRIGQDLHDIVCQELSATALFLKSSANNMERKNPAIAKTLNEAAIAVNRNVVHARDLARGFQPVELSGGEFAAALRALVAQTNAKRSLKCRLEMPRPISPRDETVTLNLYRLAQEALFNAVKHSGAREAVVSLTRDRRQLRLTVEDNGKGFRASKRTKGLGLHIMRYRAGVLGGTFAVESKPGKGTRITCIVPVKLASLKK